MQEEGSRKEGLAQNFIIILPPHFFPLCVIILIPSKLYNRQSLHCSENFSLSSTEVGECRNKVMHLQDLCHKTLLVQFDKKPFDLDFGQTFSVEVGILRFMLFLLATSGAVYVIMRHNWATASGPKLPSKKCASFLGAACR